jgi:dTDP-glucose pyrophosphorylase
MVSVVYMVAGLSSRFGGKIKQFARVGKNGETLIEISIKQALKGGCDEIIFIVGDKTEKPFKKMFGEEFEGVKIKYAKQELPETRDKPWGTCDALLCAKNVINKKFIVCNGDDLYGENTFKQLVDYEGENATAGYKLIDVVPENGSVNRGIFSVDENNFVTEINETLNIEKDKLEKRNLKEDTLCSQNIFILERNVLDLLGEKLNEFKEEHEGDRKSECYLPTELGNLIKEGKIKIKLLMAEDKWFGVTNPEDEEIIRKQIANE